MIISSWHRQCPSLHTRNHLRRESARGRANSELHRWWWDVILNVGIYRLNHSAVRDRDANNPISLKMKLANMTSWISVMMYVMIVTEIALSQSQFDWVAGYKHHWEFPTNEKIIPTIACPFVQAFLSFILHHILYYISGCIGWVVSMSEILAVFGAHLQLRRHQQTTPSGE